MKLVHYIRETARTPIRDQRKAAEQHRENNVHEVIEGYKGATFDDVLKLLRRGSGVVVHSFKILARGKLQQKERAQQIADRGAYLLSCELAVSKESRIAHNRTPDEVRERAFEFWQRNDLTNRQVEDLAGIPYGTMRHWWQNDHPRKYARFGRPPGVKDSKPRKRRKN